MVGDFQSEVSNNLLVWKFLLIFSSVIDLINFVSKGIQLDVYRLWRGIWQMQKSVRARGSVIFKCWIFFLSNQGCFQDF
jgi:hypothetical protein